MFTLPLLPKIKIMRQVPGCWSSVWLLWIFWHFSTFCQLRTWTPSAFQQSHQCKEENRSWKNISAANVSALLSLKCELPWRDEKQAVTHGPRLQIAVCDHKSPHRKTQSQNLGLIPQLINKYNYCIWLVKLQFQHKRYQYYKILFKVPVTTYLYIHMNLPVWSLDK